MAEALHPEVRHESQHSRREAARPARESSMRPRPVDYDWSQLRVHWYKDDPQMTHTVNVLNLLLPEGETWFVRVFAACLPYLPENPQLRKEIRGFMGQEAHHANAHQELLDYLDAHDISTTAYTDFISWLLRDMLGDAPFGMKLKSSRLQRVWNTFRLGGVAALEHVTAFLGSWALNCERFDDDNVDATMVDLIRWHGAEEVEHQSVALDMMEAISPRYHHLWRSGVFLIALPALFAAWVEGTRYLMKQDDSIEDGPTWKAYWDAVEDGHLPSFVELLKTTPRLLDKNYDPRIEEAEMMAKAVRQIEMSHGAHMV